MTLAIREAVIHHRALVAFTESLQAENASLVSTWEDSVRRWELDPLNVTCPYDIPEESKRSSNFFNLLASKMKADVNWAEVKRQLAVEDHLEVAAGNAVEGNVTPSAFVVVALELEEAQ